MFLEWRLLLDAILNDPGKRLTQGTQPHLMITPNTNPPHFPNFETNPLSKDFPSDRLFPKTRYCKILWKNRKKQNGEISMVSLIPHNPSYIGFHVIQLDYGTLISNYPYQKRIQQ